jgi:tyrosyl-tRNA synthetase
VDEVLSRGVEEIIEKDHLKELMLSGKQLRIKFGVDPTAPDLHLGHAVPLRKLKQFQELGHKIVLIIGDFTARIGDPSGRSEERKPLSDKDVKNNMKNYLSHASKIIDIKKTEINYNSKWFLKESMKEVLELSSAGSIQQVLRRADFKKRLDEGSDITLTEVLYPLFQGYDSVKVKADLEIGGTDQLFNLLMGRRVQRHFNMAEQDVLTTPLLEGIDGVKKMSKSAGNYISLTDKPFDMFEKVMNVPDTLIEKYFMLTTDLSEEEINGSLSKIKAGANPRGIKMNLAGSIVKIYHSEKDAMYAKEEYEKRSSGEKPTDIKEYKISQSGMSLVDILVSADISTSNSDAKRLIEQGGVKVDDRVHDDWKEIVEFNGGEIIQAGKRNFLKIKL